MTIILGIDPGSCKTGFGLIKTDGIKHHYISSGTIRLPKAEIPERLQQIFEDLGQIIREFQPNEMSVEQVFMAQNPNSALKLGQARGAAIVAGTQHGLAVSEYSARQIKQSVVGTGAADKSQVQHMVRTILSLPGLPQEDAADALAAALCHAHSRHIANVTGTSRYKWGRLSP